MQEMSSGIRNKTVVVNDVVVFCRSVNLVVVVVSVFGLLPEKSREGERGRKRVR